MAKQEGCKYDLFNPVSRHLFVSVEVDGFGNPGPALHCGRGSGVCKRARERQRDRAQAAGLGILSQLIANQRLARVCTQGRGCMHAAFFYFIILFFFMLTI